jgi:hypothetical protein
MNPIPEYEELRKTAEEKLRKNLNGDSRVKLVKGYDEETLKIIRDIDNEKFREELQYTEDEIEERMKNKGFLCFLIYLDGKPIAFEYGYDIGEGVYFSDSQATLIEGKGIGTTQFALEILYLYHKGYAKVKLTTEELDEQGRALRNFWERMGFVKLGEDPDGNVEMELYLTPEVAQYQYERYILPRN